MEKMSEKRFEDILKFLERYNKIREKVEKRIASGKKIGGLASRMLELLDRKHSRLCRELILHDLSDIAPNFIEEHKDEYWIFSIPSEYQRRELADDRDYKYLSLGDIKKYNLTQKRGFNINDYQIFNKISSEEKEIIEKYGIEILEYIDTGILQTKRYNSEFFERIQEILKNKDMSDGDDLITEQIKQVNIELILKVLRSNNYDPKVNQSLMENPDTIELMSDYFINDLSKEDLIRKMAGLSLSIEDIAENLEVFQGKKIIWSLNYYFKDILEKNNIDDDKFTYFIKNFADLFVPLAKQRYFSDIILKLMEEIDLSKELDENRKKVLETFSLLVDSESYDNNLFKIYFDLMPIEESITNIRDLNEMKEIWQIIIDSSSEEKIKSYNIPVEVLKDFKTIKLIAAFGIDNLAELFKNVKYPSAYWHGLADLYKTASGMKINTAYYFDESVMDGLKKLRPDLYLDESAPDGLKAKFYKDVKMSLVDLFNPEYIKYLEGKSFEFCDWNEEKYYSGYNSKYLVEKLGLEKIKEFISLIDLDKELDEEKRTKKIEDYLTVLNEYCKKDKETLPNYDKFFYLIKKDPELIDEFITHNQNLEHLFKILSVIDLEKSDDENLEQIYTILVGLYQDVRIVGDITNIVPFSKYYPVLSNNLKLQKLYKKIAESASDEDIKTVSTWTSQGKNGFWDSEFVGFVSIFGVKQILDFEQKNPGSLSVMSIETVCEIMGFDRILDCNTFEILENDSPDLNKCMARMLLREINGSYKNKWIKTIPFSNEFKRIFIDEYFEGKNIEEEKKEILKKVLDKYSMKYIGLLLKDKNFSEMDFDNLSEKEVEETVLKSIKEIIRYEKDIEHDQMIKDSFPEFFLDEEAPQILLSEYYSFELGIKRLSFKENCIFLQDKDFFRSRIFRTEKKFDLYREHQNEFLKRVNKGIGEEDNLDEHERYTMFISYLIEDKGKTPKNESIERFLSKFPLKYFYYFSKSDFERLEGVIDNSEKAEEIFFEIVKRQIDEGYVLLDKSEPDEFKEKFSEYYLDESAPDKLKRYFYQAHLVWR